MNYSNIKNDKVRGTVFHEVGHFLTGYLYEPDAFDEIIINAKLREDPFASVPDEDLPFGRTTGITSSGLCRNYYQHITKRKYSIILCAGVIAERILHKRTTRPELKPHGTERSDRQKLDGLGLTQKEKEESYREAERILQENKDLLYFISKRILQIRREENYPDELTIDREGMKSILQEYKTR